MKCLNLKWQYNYNIKYNTFTQTLIRKHDQQINWLRYLILQLRIFRNSLIAVIWLIVKCSRTDETSSFDIEIAPRRSVSPMGFLGPSQLEKLLSTFTILSFKSVINPRRLSLAALLALFVHLFFLPFFCCTGFVNSAQIALNNVDKPKT